MVASGNPHLVALESVARSQGVLFMTVTVRRGAGGHIRQRRTRLRFAQAHGARKTAVELVQRKHLFLQVRAVFHQQIGVAHGQHATTNADGGTSEKCVGGRFHGVRQLHATNIEVLRRTQHAALHIGVMRILGAGGQDDLLAIKSRLLNVYRAIERRVFVTGNALTGVEHRIKGVAGVVGKAAPLRQALGGQPVVEQKINSLSEGHGCTLKRHCEAAGRSNHSTSKMPAAPMPPPMHMVTQTRLAPRRLPSIKAWPVRR